jgi:hypothetical protein
LQLILEGKLLALVDPLTALTVLLPHLLQASTQSNNLLVRVKSVQCVTKLVSPMDKQTAVERLLPPLRQTSFGKHPALDGALVDLYDKIGALKSKWVDSAFIGGELVPDLWRLATGPSMRNSEEYAAARQVINRLVERIDAIQATKLLSNSNNGSSVSQNSTHNNSAKNETKSFENLVLGSQQQQQSFNRRQSTAFSSNSSLSSTSSKPATRQSSMHLQLPNNRISKNNPAAEQLLNGPKTLNLNNSPSFNAMIPVLTPPPPASSSTQFDSLI